MGPFNCASGKQARGTDAPEPEDEHMRAPSSKGGVDVPVLAEVKEPFQKQPGSEAALQQPPEPEEAANPVSKDANPLAAGVEQTCPLNEVDQTGAADAVDPAALREAKDQPAALQPSGNSPFLWGHLPEVTDVIGRMSGAADVTCMLTCQTRQRHCRRDP